MIPAFRAALAFILLASSAVAQVATAPIPSGLPTLTVNQLQLNPSQLAAGDGFYNLGATHRVYPSINGASNGCYFDSAGLEACPLAGSTLNKWTLTAPATGITVTGTDGQTYTLPSVTSTLAALGVAQIFTASQTFLSHLYLGSASDMHFGTNLAVIATVPTVAAANFQASGSPTVTGSHTAAFRVTLTGTASGSGQITFSVAATNGWACQGNDLTTSGVTFRESATDTTHATMTVSGSPGSSDQYQFICIAY